MTEFNEDVLIKANLTVDENANVIGGHLFFGTADRLALLSRSKELVINSGTGWSDGVKVESNLTVDENANVIGGQFFLGPDGKLALLSGAEHLIINSVSGWTQGVRVVGDLEVTRGDLNVDQNVNVKGDILLEGADCAEDFDVAEPEVIEPGTVLALDQEGKLRQSSEAYDKKVAGVVSGAGGFRPGIRLDQQHESKGSRMPIALVGKVFCKADASQSPIEVGDLLTTSDVPGHAMKAADPFKAFGAVIGKALRPLETGTGLIPILVALQ